MAKSSEFDNDGVRKALFLGGCVCCPDSFPRLAVLWIDAVDSERVLRIEEQRHTVHVVRTVKLRDVAAVFIPKDPSSPDLSESSWAFGSKIKKEFKELRQKQKNHPKGGKAYGLAYIPESCSVASQVLTALTASQSEDFVAKASLSFQCDPDPC